MSSNLGGKRKHTQMVQSKVHFFPINIRLEKHTHKCSEEKYWHIILQVNASHTSVGESHLKKNLSPANLYCNFHHCRSHRSRRFGVKWQFASPAMETSAAKMEKSPPVASVVPQHRMWPRVKNTRFIGALLNLFLLQVTHRYYTLSTHFVVLCTNSMMKLLILYLISWRYNAIPIFWLVLVFHSRKSIASFCMLNTASFKSCPNIPPSPPKKVLDATHVNCRGNNSKTASMTAVTWLAHDTVSSGFRTTMTTTSHQPDCSCHSLGSLLCSVFCVSVQITKTMMSVSLLFVPSGHFLLQHPNCAWGVVCFKTSVCSRHF